ncbi:hypothetical protein [Thiorhodovibrio frisius]|uniref:CD-NTase associated protein 4-like DNA endonuclease domain-containing protein n=1 Tax=Thiorhodovibrio frisius TaxID=631362 RepID=H8YVR1_9GAMM|nr:hypothetical protein [Thiorhodovibrio frisius]EIC24001.1 hypothetical protein Thi970DRAFT_00138 [Thiorhodovibrio frisius]WPL23074.1 hypothetical protein Thiofri_03256 [Thiorhodovibrio frisius]
MDLVEFVENRFGVKCAGSLGRIRVGGDSNQKGGLYEDFFAVSLSCSLASQEQELEQYQIAAQEVAFVDDLCIRDYSRNTKTNYQAKNSSGKAAQWTPHIERMFRYQRRIDEEFFKFEKSVQVLLVSCKEIASANSQKIPADARDGFRSEFFPYKASSTQLILEHEELRGNLEKICDSTEPADIDSAFRILLGVWRSDQDPMTVQELFLRARKESKPDLFQGMLKREACVPQWLEEKCQELKGISVRLGTGRCLVVFNGFEVSFPLSAPTPEMRELDEIVSIDQLFMRLMLLATTELND